MKILVLGMPRTGTQSLTDALSFLGISPGYHMREVGKNKHQDVWVDWIEAKYEGKGQPPQRKQFDQILDSFEVVADYPAAIFAAELVEAYPEAAIILTTRDEAKWYESMMNTLIHSFRNAPSPNPSPMASLARKYHLHCWANDFPSYGREAFRRQEEVVRQAAVGRKFLVYNTGSGWEPLCSFLGLSIPDSPYPRNDDWLEYKKQVEEDKQKKEGKS
ncbi:P-loop containing nucleoside triphosphate hydrolase protein [Xylariales sp. PMI_506]|nr:P-loop containing nucleoside triphosphate hydrolase protein [Xylariales sp. PMI_506]